MNELPKIQRVARVAQAFTPAAPVHKLDLFAGRLNQIHDVVSAASNRGQHAVLYGERGVGKTSLASILAELFALPGFPDYQAAVVNCATDDTFDGLWRNVFRELGIDPPLTRVSPEDVRYTLTRLDPPALIVIDELDRLADDESLSLLADTVKTLSDHGVDSTLVLVGVAQSVGELIGEHESVSRALVQIEIPRMTRKELHEILEKGCQRAGLGIAPRAAERIVRLSEGLPHYTHLLALASGTRAAQDDRGEITVEDVAAAIPLAVAKHTIRSHYSLATRSARADNLYREVLLACALARKNNLGFFTAGAVRDPLAQIVGKRLEIPAFARHLRAFLEPERGSVLHREGEERRYFYRFSDPIMQPYVILEGLADGLVSEDQITAIQGLPPASDESPVTRLPGLF